MRLVFWLDLFFMSIGILLIQITDDSLKYIKNLNEDDDWEYESTFSEAMVFEIPRLLSVSANHFIEFSKTQIILFEKIFILNEVASFDNIAVLSEMFNSGHTMQGGIDQIMCIIFRKSEDPKCDLLY